MIEVVEFKAEHLIDILNVDGMVARRAVMAEENMKRGGLGYSALLDGKCIGCAWVLDEGDKMTVWLQVTDVLLAHKVWLHRTAKRLWKVVKDQAGDKPLNALCDTSIAKNVKWASRFGFELTPIVVLEAVN